MPAPRCRGSPSRPRRPPLSNRACDDRGSASLLAVALIAILLAFTTGAAYLGAAVIARHRAQAAADLAALAAAGAVAGGPEAACARASQIASAMRTTVAACRVDGLDVVLDVQVRVSLGRFGTGSARAVARAGPVET
ncbi:Rv3654c family TadE-like protein [Mycolicibacterium wolinskyi]|uniref:Rv3654c family TadE-like protein n=1 Tax=Mycolicibacterium wolinskyi TaxID=59750 RepID=UPI002E14E646